MTLIKVVQIFFKLGDNLKNVDSRANFFFSILHIKYVGIDTILTLEPSKIKNHDAKLKGYSFFIQVRSKIRRMSRSSKEKLTRPSASPHLLLTYISYSGRGT